MQPIISDGFVVFHFLSKLNHYKKGLFFVFFYVNSPQKLSVEERKKKIKKLLIGGGGGGELFKLISPDNCLLFH